MERLPMRVIGSLKGREARESAIPLGAEVAPGAVVPGEWG
jgi:hypothetical protein